MLDKVIVHRVDFCRNYFVKQYFTFVSEADFLSFVEVMHDFKIYKDFRLDIRAK